jgi:hypothetical protein
MAVWIEVATRPVKGPTGRFLKPLECNRVLPLPFSIASHQSKIRFRPKAPSRIRSDPTEACRNIEKVAQLQSEAF